MLSRIHTISFSDSESPLDQYLDKLYPSLIDLQGMHMSEPLFTEVEAKLTTLIVRYQQLNAAYQNIVERELAWTAERVRLLEKNDIARARIEAMIPRLKQLENIAE